MRASTSITFYGGVTEIGGNRFLVKDKDTTIMMDFGTSFGAEAKYFSEYRKARSSNILVDLFELGLLPNIEGLYRKDYAEHMKIKYTETPPIDAIILTHAHIDHCGYLNLIREDIPVYCTKESELIMRCFDETSDKYQLLTLKTKFVYKPNSLTRLRGVTRKRVIHIMKSGTKFNVGSIGIEPCAVDHSLPGTCAIILHTSSGVIANTADLRFHGRRGSETQDFVDRCGDSDLDLLLCEGTRISDPGNDKSEEWLETEAAKIMKSTNGLVVCGYPIRDLDRMMSLYLATKSAGKRFVVDAKQAYLLDQFHSDLPNTYPSLNDVCVFTDRGSWGLIDKTDSAEELRKDYSNSSFKEEFLDIPNKIDYRDIKSNPKDFVFSCGDFSLQNLIDIKPPKGSTYIRSLTEPFDTEMEISETKIKNWLGHFGLINSEKDWHQLHVSGHGDGTQIKRVIDGSKSKVLIPIHTENEDYHKKWHSNVKSVDLGYTYDV